MLLGLGRERLLEGEADPGARPFSERPGTRLHQLLVEQFVERQPAPARFRLGQRGRPVHRRERGPELGESDRRAQALGMGVRHQGEQCFQVLMDQAADLPMREPFGRGIHRQHEAALGGFPLVRENHKLARHELAAVVVAHRPRHAQQLAFLELSLEKRLTGPGTLERTTAALITQHRPEYPQALAGGEHSRADHAADAGHFLAHLHLGHRRDRRGVQITVGCVVQQVADAPDTEPGERLGTLRPHALQVFHRRPELERHPLMSLRATRFGSNTSRSSSPSPVPRNRIGTRTARSSATTLPPFAVPSSLVTMRPLSGTAAAKARAWCTAFCPTVASTTSNDSCGAPGCCFATTRTTFFSSSSSRSSVWSRPAVSTSTVSAPRARAAAIASNATAAGSFVPPPVTHGTPSRSAQICSCSAAPARKVSAAARSTDRPPRASRAPSLATAVVFPTPLTPKTSMTVGGAEARASAPGSPPGDAGVSAPITARSSAARKSRSPSPPPETRSRISSVLSTPKSASSKIRSASPRSRAPRPNTRASRSHKAIRASPRAAATPTRPRRRRSPGRTTTTGPAAPRP